MAEIKCPMCGKSNPGDLDVCQFCEARLKPLTDQLSRSQPPLHPGEEPTQMDTGELEPILPQWLREVRQQARESAEEKVEQAPVEEEALQPEEPGDLLAGLRSQAEKDEEIPDWLSGLRGESVRPTRGGASPEEDDLSALRSMLGEEAPTVGESEASELPGWISDLGASETEEPAGEDALSGLLAGSAEKEQPPASSSDFEWAADFGADTGALEEPSQVTPAWESEERAQPTAAKSDMPDWLASLGEQGAEPLSPGPTQPAEEGDVSDWLASLDAEGAEPAPQEPARPAVEGETPDWLSSLGGEIEPAGAGESTSAAAFAEPSQPVEEEETPDWLSSLGREMVEPEQPAQGVRTPAFTEEPAEEVSAAPAFVDDEGAPLAPDDVDAIFSMDMPDWLSEASSAGEREGEIPAAQADDLRPADLPSWVQAMRPVESVISEAEEDIQAEQPMEEKGPLAGLRGVLPAMPGFGPSSKPKAYSIKLRASEEQQASAVMLEQLLASEINPEPIFTQKVVNTQRFLRWIIAILLLLVVGGSIFTGTQMNPMPVGAPPETSAAIRYIQESLPPDAPVLMIFDYEAALAGELEAVAAPFVDHMLLLKHPRLSLISSMPTGAGLAERFMRTTQSGHNYQEGQQLVDLGYLPGGAAGVLAFAENPASIKPNTITGKDAWSTPVLQNVRQLSDFAAIILLTNDVETARIWIEQTETVRGETPFLVISSAQSGPMILPYVQTGQVDGIVTGLDGSAPIEQVNSGRPGMVRRYWDAYGLGLLTALAMISFGSLWSLIAGWQIRRKERGEA